MTRILRAKSITSPKTPRNISVGKGIELSKNVIYQRGRQLVAASKRRPVKIKMVRDPASPTSRAAFDEFTNSTNLSVDLGKRSGNVKRLDSTPDPPTRGAQKGHSKVVRPNRQSLFGGKTLKKRT